MNKKKFNSSHKYIHQNLLKCYFIKNTTYGRFILTKKKNFFSSFPLKIVFFFLLFSLLFLEVRNEPTIFEYLYYYCMENSQTGVENPKSFSVCIYKPEQFTINRRLTLFITTHFVIVFECIISKYHM